MQPKTKTMYQPLSIQATVIRIIIFSLLLAACSLTCNAVPMLRLQMHGPSNFNDETVLYYQQGATDGFDASYDAYDLMGFNPAPHISQEYNSVLMAINGITPVNPTFSINIRTISNTSGNFTITAADFSELPAGTCAYLKDRVTGSSVNILLSSYAFALADTTAASRFILLITHYTVPLTTSLTQPACPLQSFGKCKVAATGSGLWNYTWKDSAGNVVRTTLNASGCDSLNNLAGGIYHVEVQPANNACYIGADTVFFIHSVIPAELPLTTKLSQPGCKAQDGGTYKATASGSGPWNYTWKNSVGNTIKTTLSAYGCDSLYNLDDGAYYLEVEPVDNACYYSTSTSFVIHAADVPSLSFTAPDTTVAGAQNNYAPINHSENCATYSWNFGDGSDCSSAFNAQHCYSLQGLYTVQLKGVSVNGCADSVSKTIRVIDRATSIKIELSQSIGLMSLGNDQFMLRSSKDLSEGLSVSLIAMDGKQVFEQMLAPGSGKEASLNFRGTGAGIYILRIGSHSDVVLSSRIILGSYN